MLSPVCSEPSSMQGIITCSITACAYTASSNALRGRTSSHAKLINITHLANLPT